MKKNPPMASSSFDYSMSFTIFFWSSLSFTHVLHLYPISKWLNELNIININLYMIHMLIPWGVMTSHRISIGSKLIEVSKRRIGHLNNS